MKFLLASSAANIVEEFVTSKKLKPHELKMVCITTAAKVEKITDWLNAELSTFTRIGFNFTIYDIDGQTEADVYQTLQSADVIYVSGGNTYFLLEKIKACNFEKIIRHDLRSETLYIGSSAGSIVCCPDIGYIKNLDDPTRANLTNFIGMNLIDINLMVHINHPDFSPELRRSYLQELKSDNRWTFCLHDHQALYIDGKNIYLFESNQNKMQG